MRDLIGKQVVCIDDKVDPSVKALFQEFVVEGTIYTIRDAFTNRNGPAFHLQEIHNPKVEFEGFWFEPSFHQRRFEFIDDINIEELFTEKILEHDF